MADKSINSVIYSILDKIAIEMAMNMSHDDYEIGFEQGLETAYGIVEGYLTWL